MELNCFMEKSNNQIYQYIKKHANILAFISCFIGIFIFHLISYNRVGYYVDEIGSMYDAYCISNFGVDRWLNAYPIHFLNYGDGQCSSFVYILTVLFKLFGYEKWVIRLVPTLFHILTVFFIGKLVGLYDKKLEKFGYIFTSIFPIFYMLFQFGLESHFMITFSAAFLYFLCKGVELQKNIYFLAGGVCVGLVFHTYVLSYICIPLFIVLYVIYLWKRKKITIKQIIIFMIPVLFFGIPLLIVQIINIFDLKPFVFLGITFPKFLFYRGNELGFSDFFQNIYKTFVNTNFFDTQAHLCIPTFGNVYYVSIPFVLIGFIKHLKQFKENYISAAFILWIVSMYFLAGLLQEPGSINNTRLNALYLTKVACLLEGIGFCINRAKKSRKWLNYCIVLVYGCLLISFISTYFTRYNLNTQSNLFLESYEDLPEMDGHVYLPDNYCYFLWSKKINPYDFDIKNNGYKQYENYHMGYQKLNTSSYYVISKNDNVSQDTLNRLGFQIVKELQHYYVYAFQ